MAAATGKRILRWSGLAAVLVCVYLVATIGLDAFAIRKASRVAHLASLHVKSLLSPLAMDQLGDMIQDFDINSAGVIVVCSGNRLFCITPSSSDSSSQVEALEIANNGHPDSLAFDNDDALLTVADGYWGMLDEGGQLLNALPLPFENGRLARSTYKGAVYLFGGAGRNFHLYRLVADGTLQILLDSSVAIKAVADFGNEIYVATENSILQLHQGSPTVLFKAPDEPGWGPIVSLTASADRGLLFFATSSKVYALEKSMSLAVVGDAGGALRLQGDKLYLTDSARRQLFLLQPASRQLFAEGSH